VSDNPIKFTKPSALRAMPRGKEQSPTAIVPKNRTKLKEKKNNGSK